MRKMPQESWSRGCHPKKKQSWRSTTMFFFGTWSWVGTARRLAKSSTCFSKRLTFSRISASEPPMENGNIWQQMATTSATKFETLNLLRLWRLWRLWQVEHCQVHPVSKSIARCNTKLIELLTDNKNICQWQFWRQESHFNHSTIPALLRLDFSWVVGLSNDAFCSRWD